MTKFIAETKKRYLSIYIRSFPSKKNGDDNRKVVYLATFLITCFHEIFGHLFIRIHNYLNKNNQIAIFYIIIIRQSQNLEVAMQKIEVKNQVNILKNYYLAIMKLK